MNGAVIGVSVAAGAAVLAAGAYALAASPRVPPLRVSSTPRVARIGRVMTQTETLERFASSPGEYHLFTGAPNPAWRKIPIVPLQWFPLVPSMRRGVKISDQPGAVMTEVLAEWRRICRAVGREDDPRASLWLYLKETAWGKACWGRNTGNRKASEHANRATILAPGDPHVYTENPYADRLQLLQDRELSFDSYRGFPDYETAMRDETRLFSNPRYAGVLPGYTRGGVAGLKAAIESMHRGGYSGGVLATKLHECDEYWAIGQRKCGAAWVR